MALLAFKFRLLAPYFFNESHTWHCFFFYAFDLNFDFVPISQASVTPL